MPRRLKKGKKTTFLTEEQKRHLFTGKTFSSGLPFHGVPGFPFASEEERRELWNQNKKTLLAEYIRDHPGERPHAWWTYDNKNGLRELTGWLNIKARLEGRVDDFDTPLPVSAGSTDWIKTDIPPSFGRYKAYCGGVPIYESQREFLERHNLLTPEEKRALENE